MSNNISIAGQGKEMEDITKRDKNCCQWKILAIPTIIKNITYVFLSLITYTVPLKMTKNKANVYCIDIRNK